MADTIDVFWSFRSPYSYIALPRLVALADRFGATLDVRVVHPAALRNPDYFRAMNPLARPYFMLDSARAARFHGLPFRRPVPDPIAQDPVTLALAAERPLARPPARPARYRRGGARPCRAVPFCLEVSRLLWDGQVDGWNEGSHLAEAAERAGLDLAELTASVASDPEAHEAALARNDDALRAAGHWGVPTMVYRGEPFFGQDRIDVLAWRLVGRGF